MNIELSTSQELRTQLSSIDSFIAHLEEISQESPERVYIFTNRLKNALEKLEKNTKDGAIRHQETYGELGAGYSLRVSQRAKYDIDTPEYLIAKNALKELEDTLKLKIDLDEKEHGMSDKKSYTQIYSLQSPK
ncbi:MAG: hypothetical protein U0518_04610 [Candidatus Gracilibacteria bacterium]